MYYLLYIPDGFEFDALLLFIIGIVGYSIQKIKEKNRNNKINEWEIIKFYQQKKTDKWIQIYQDEDIQFLISANTISENGHSITFYGKEVFLNEISKAQVIPFFKNESWLQKDWDEHQFYIDAEKKITVVNEIHYKCYINDDTISICPKEINIEGLKEHTSNKQKTVDIPTSEGWDWIQRSLVEIHISKILVHHIYNFSTYILKELHLSYSFIGDLYFCLENFIDSDYCQFQHFIQTDERYIKSIFNELTKKDQLKILDKKLTFKVFKHLVYSNPTRSAYMKFKNIENFKKIHPSAIVTQPILFQYK